MLLFIPISFNKCILSIYCVLGIFPDAEDKVGRQIQSLPGEC